MLPELRAYQTFIDLGNGAVLTSNSTDYRVILTLIDSA